jgi:hypothetical protein
MMGEKKMFTSYVKNKDSQDMIIMEMGTKARSKAWAR